jgi:integrase
MLIKRRRKAKRRKQAGQIITIGDHWYVRYWSRQVENRCGVCKLNEDKRHENAGHAFVREAVVERKRRTTMLGLKTTRGRTAPDAIKNAAEDFMRGLNRTTVSTDRTITIGKFAKDVFLPYVTAHKRPSTALAYKQIWECHLQPQAITVDGIRRPCSELMVRDMETRDAQEWLEEIVRTSKHPLSKSTLKHCKFTLSGMFRLALQQGYRTKERGHPVEDCSIPIGTVGTKQTHAYTIEETRQMLAVLGEPARTVIALAAFTGLRVGEIEALTWQDINGDVLTVGRSIWRGKVSLPKTDASAAPVFIPKALADMLEIHRAISGFPGSGPIFRTSTGSPLAMHNVLNREILPVLRRCAICGKVPGKRHHLKQEKPHEYEREPTMPEWHGWHGFRRGVATNLQHLGANVITAQGALRHSDASVTLKHYTKIVSDDIRTSMGGYVNLLMKNPSRDTNGTPKQATGKQSQIVN